MNKVVLFFFISKEIFAILFQNLFLYWGFFIALCGAVFFVFNYMTPQFLGEKPHIITIQQITINLKLNDLYMPDFRGYTYDFIDKHGNSCKGWIPFELLED